MLTLRAAVMAAIAVAGLPVNVAAATIALPAKPMQLRTVAGSPGAGPATALAQRVEAMTYRDGVLYSVNPVSGGRVLRALDLATGEQRVLAGGTRPRSPFEGPAATRLLGRTTGLGVDAAGRAWYADDDSRELVRIDTAAGTMTIPPLVDDPPLSGIPEQKAFERPGAVTVTAAGMPYVVDDTDTWNARIYTVDHANARRTRVAGGGSATGCATGPAKSVKLRVVTGLALDAAGRLLVSGDGCVRRLEPSGDLVRVAGSGPDSGTLENRGDGGPATAARLEPGAIAVDGDVLYVVDANRVRRVGADGVITTIAGNGSQRLPADGAAPLTAAQAGDGSPATTVPLSTGALAAGGGRVYVYDWGTLRIRVVENGVIGTVAGNGHGTAGGDGLQATAAQLQSPTDVAALPGGGFVVADPQTRTVRKVAADGVVSTLAGNGAWGPTVDGARATETAFTSPQIVAAAPDGSVYVGNWRLVHRIGTDGVVTHVAGIDSYNQPAPVDGVPATQSSILAYGLDVGSDGSLYIASGAHYRVRRVRPDGIVETVAGGNGMGFSGDGGPARLAQFGEVTDVDVQPDGGYYVADWNNDRIRYVSPAGIVTTVAGGGADSPGGPWDGDGDGGPATSAYVATPGSVTAAPDGTFYVGQGSVVREVRGGVIRTVAGGWSHDRNATADVVAATRAPMLGAGHSDWTPGGLLIPENGAARVRLLLPDVPPAAPAPVTVSPGARRLTVRWTEPSYAGSPADSYTVTATPPSGSAVTRAVPGTERETRLVGLRNGVAYDVTVVATNGAGKGAAATATAEPRAGLPGPPRYVAARPGNASAEVAWTRPDDGLGVLEAYRVTAHPGGATAEVPASATSAVVGGLANGTAYRFTVAARNDAGWGEASPLTEPVTPHPAPVPAIDVSGALDGAQVVTFSEPVRDVYGGNVVLRDVATGRAVSASLGCRTSSGAATSCALGPVTTVTLRPRSPLTAGATYRLSVNPAGARPAEDAGGLPAPATSATFRASASEQEGTVGGRRLWRRVADSRAEGGQYAVERQRGAAATATVTGTTVTWLTALGPDMGRGELWVDGTLRATYDNRAAARAWRVRRTVTGLANTAHTVEVRVAGGGYVVVDSLGAPARYEWRKVASASASGGAYAVAELAGAEASFTFRGTSLAWYAVRGPGAGRIAVYVDGKRTTEIDYYAATRAYGYRRGVAGLPAGVHTVRLVVLGTKSSASSGTAFALDRWLVTG